MIKYGLLTAQDEWASEEEVYDFLYALVRLLKPKVILETGTYKAGATSAMSQGAKENGFGRIYTCDTDAALVERAAIDLKPYFFTSVHCMTGVGLAEMQAENKSYGVDFAYIDSSGDRVEEIRNLQLTPNAVVVLHDSKRPQYRPIWTLKPWRNIWEIETEQGLAVFQL